MLTSVDITFRPFLYILLIMLVTNCSFFNMIFCSSATNELHSAFSYTLFSLKSWTSRQKHHVHLNSTLALFYNMTVWFISLFYVPTKTSLQMKRSIWQRRCVTKIRFTASSNHLIYAKDLPVWHSERKECGRGISPSLISFWLFISH